ncbi:MAG: hypothetical protein M3280_09785 [Actinomycetota bacterium]|nr:hypothetical protein [Actinomycetota bacterium]
MHLPHISRRTALIAIGVVAVAGVAGFALTRGDNEALEKLETAGRQSEKASTSSERIRESLKEIARNLEEASGLSGKSSKIEKLTAAQRQSLTDLVVLLKGQLKTLERTSGIVEGATSSTASVAKLSEGQTERLEEAIAVLRSLEDLAAGATGDSADLAHRARYSARLAEDSQESFER